MYSTNVSAPSAIATTTAAAAGYPIPLAGFLRDKFANVIPHKNIPSAVFAFMEIKPGRKLFSVGTFRIHPASTIAPVSAAIRPEAKARDLQRPASSDSDCDIENTIAFLSPQVRPDDTETAHGENLWKWSEAVGRRLRTRFKAATGRQIQAMV